MSNVCVVCNKEYTRKAIISQTCSALCYAKLQYTKNRQVIKCAVCDNTFLQKNDFKKFCSKKCGDKVARQNCDKEKRRLYQIEYRKKNNVFQYKDRAIDLTGKKFYKLTVINRSKDRGNKGEIKWDCKCDCGNNHTVSGNVLRSGKSKSCGCLVNGRPVNFKHNRDVVLWQKIYSSTVIKRSKKNNVISDISFEKFIELSKSACHYCGMHGSNKIIDDIKNNNGNFLLFNGLDRLDSNLGYTLNNTVSCCKYCNVAKNTQTKQEFLDFIKRIYEFNFK